MGSSGDTSARQGGRLGGYHRPRCEIDKTTCSGQRAAGSEQHKTVATTSVSPRLAMRRRTHEASCSSNSLWEGGRRKQTSLHLTKTPNPGPMLTRFCCVCHGLWRSGPLGKPGSSGGWGGTYVIGGGPRSIGRVSDVETSLFSTRTELDWPTERDSTRLARWACLGGVQVGFSQVSTTPPGKRGGVVDQTR